MGSTGREIQCAQEARAGGENNSAVWRCRRRDRAAKSEETEGIKNEDDRLKREEISRSGEQKRGKHRTSRRGPPTPSHTSHTLPISRCSPSRVYIYTLCTPRAQCPTPQVTAICCRILVILPSTAFGVALASARVQVVSYLLTSALNQKKEYTVTNELLVLECGFITRGGTEKRGGHLCPKPWIASKSFIH